MKKTFVVECREEGRGKPTVAKFSTLKEASQYIQDRWQGAEYADGSDGFHTDYASFQLVGFTLRDIGKFFVTEDGGLSFRFNSDGSDESEDYPDRDSLVAAGLLEGEGYRDFPSGNDCFPEDWFETPKDHPYQGDPAGWDEWWAKNGF